ncbi:MAG TPA: hypothetical protein VND96_18515 [Candidatus Micrarchaeaceae archaeon]|nr:hypothetical protein [Candidatus Micrarchaeaceae archaeon]
MSTGPAVQPGQLSPDGLWRWDGITWVPVTAGAPMPPPRSSRSWIWWLVGGCGVLLILGAVGAGFGIYSLVNRFQHGGFSCLPSDFPTYPNASVVNESTQIGNEFSPGDSTRCNMGFDSNDDVASVTAYYEAQLNDGDWTIVTTDSANGVISFQRRSRPQTVGTLTLLGRGQHSSIDIQLDS